jgi:hypothetical protein
MCPLCFVIRLRVKRLLINLISTGCTAKKKRWLPHQIYLATSSTHVHFYLLIYYIVFSFRFRTPHTCHNFADLRCVNLLGLEIPLYCTKFRCQSVNHLKAVLSILFIFCRFYILLKLLHRLLPWTFLFHSWNFLMALYNTFDSPNLAHHPTPHKGVTIIRIT